MAVPIHDIDTSPFPKKSVTPLWTVSKDAERCDAFLIDRGSKGSEVRLMMDFQWTFPARFSERDKAISFGQKLQQRLLRPWILAVVTQDGRNVGWRTGGVRTDGDQLARAFAKRYRSCAEFRLVR